MGPRDRFIAKLLERGARMAGDPAVARRFAAEREAMRRRLEEQRERAEQVEREAAEAGWIPWLRRWLRR